MDASKLMTRQNVWPVVAIVSCAVLAYAQSLTNQFVLWDDHDLILNAEVLHSFSLLNLWTIFTTLDPELYIPLPRLSYLIEYALVGDAPLLYHCTNLVLHIINAVLVWALARRILQHTWIAFLVGLLFVLHPLHTEVVAWVSARKDLLATAFFLGSILQYLNYRETKLRSTYAWCIALFVFALMSKPTVIMLPFILLLIDWLHEKRIHKECLEEKLPLICLSVFVIVITVIGKQGQLVKLHLDERIALAIQGMTFSLGQMIAPLRLAAIHPYYHNGFFFSPITLIALLILLVLTLWIYKTRKSMPIVFFGSMFALLTYLPTIANQTKGAGSVLPYDRYGYLPSIGILFVACYLLKVLHEKVRTADRIGPYLVPIASAALCIFFLLCTQRQAVIWKNTETLFANVAHYYPDSYVAQWHLGDIYYARGEWEEAIYAYEQSLPHNPYPHFIQTKVGSIWGQLGYYATESKNYQWALEEKPDYLPARYNLVQSLLSMNRPELAKTELEKILDQDPTYLDASQLLEALDY